ncbi:hypothetical protein FRC02_005052 [Tulasnella sp. 418]|nr:hypothetical protein FRC02_005052 [Tulasnella sp. 418]
MAIAAGIMGKKIALHKVKTCVHDGNHEGTEPILPQERDVVDPQTPQGVITCTARNRYFTYSHPVMDNTSFQGGYTTSDVFYPVTYLNGNVVEQPTGIGIFFDDILVNWQSYYHHFDLGDGKNHVSFL